MNILSNKQRIINKLCFGIQPTLFILALTVSLIEVTIYPGVIQKHIIIPASFFYLVYILVTLICGIRGNVKKQNESQLLYKPILVFSIFLCISYFLSMVIGQLTYDNFIFKTIHIHPKQLVWPMLLSLSQYFLSRNKITFRKAYPTGVVANIVKVTTIFLVIVIFTDNIVNIIAKTKTDLIYIITHQDATYEEKMEFKLGKLFYDYTLFIKTNTAENSKILLPPFPSPRAAYPWPQTGNNIYMRYFLYPRTLVPGEEYNPGLDLVKENFDYVLVAWGETAATSGSYTHGWPKFDVNAEKVIYMTKDGKRVEKAGSYIYKKVEGQELWGIIKIKK